MLFVVKIGQRKGSVFEFRQQLFILHYAILKLCSCLMPERAPCTRSSPSRRSGNRLKKTANHKTKRKKQPPAKGVADKKSGNAPAASARPRIRRTQACNP